MPEILDLTGYDPVIISGVVYIVDAIDLSTETSRVIERTGGGGDAADYEIPPAGEHITGTITLQRATETTPYPQRGAEFTYDYDDSGKASTLVITEVKAARSKDDMLTLEVGVLLAARATGTPEVPLDGIKYDTRSVVYNGVPILYN